MAILETFWCVSHLSPFSPSLEDTYIAITMCPQNLNAKKEP